jgi:hypothetical protein
MPPLGVPPLGVPPALLGVPPAAPPALAPPVPPPPLGVPAFEIPPLGPLLWPPLFASPGVAELQAHRSDTEIATNLSPIMAASVSSSCAREWLETTRQALHEIDQRVHAIEARKSRRVRRVESGLSNSDWVARQITSTSALPRTARGRALANDALQVNRYFAAKLRV